MTTTMLFRLRRSKTEATAREIDSATAQYVAEAQSAAEAKDWLKIAEDVEAMLQECLRDHEEDRRLLERILTAASWDNEAAVDEANRFFQHQFELALRMHQAVKTCVALVGAFGQRVEGVPELEQATRDYERWREDLPEQLALRYQPVRAAVQQRLGEAMRNSPNESNWEELFAD